MVKNIKGYIKHSEAIANPKYALKQEDLDKVKSIYEVIELIALATSANLLNKVAPARFNQGDLGLCFAFAGCGIAEYFLKNDEINPIIEELAEMFIGYWSRYILNGNQPPEGDDGSTIIATMQALQEYGVCVETLWPYVDANEDVKPSSDAVNAASQVEVGDYFTIPQSQDQSKLDAIKTAIMNGIPVMAGWNVDDTIMNVGSDGMEPYTSNPLVQGQVAGHARYIIGYDDTITPPNAPISGAFLVMNSWGSSWGANGTSWVSYQTWLDQETDDMGITNMKNNAPVNPPKPDPNSGVVVELKKALAFLSKPTKTNVQKAVNKIENVVTELNS